MNMDEIDMDMTRGGGMKGNNKKEDEARGESRKKWLNRQNRQEGDGDDPKVNQGPKKGRIADEDWAKMSEDDKNAFLKEKRRKKNKKKQGKSSQSNQKDTTMVIEIIHKKDKSIQDHEKELREIKTSLKKARPDIAEVFHTKEARLMGLAEKGEKVNFLELKSLYAVCEVMWEHQKVQGEFSKRTEFLTQFHKERSQDVPVNIQDSVAYANARVLSLLDKLHDAFHAFKKGVKQSEEKRSDFATKQVETLNEWEQSVRKSINMGGELESKLRPLLDVYLASVQPAITASNDTVDAATMTPLLKTAKGAIRQLQKDHRDPIIKPEKPTETPEQSDSAEQNGDENKTAEGTEQVEGQAESGDPSGGGDMGSPLPQRDHIKRQVSKDDNQPSPSTIVQSADSKILAAKYKQSSASKEADHEVTSLIAQIRAELGGGGGGIAAGK